MKQAFQFHKGTIRTREKSMLVLIQLYFNSIKVRLEPFQNGLNNAVNQYFNSIKVRLELVSEQSRLYRSQISIP